jgi:hypothetical protein
VFKIKLANMRDEMGLSEGQWNIQLGPGERCLKALTLIDPFEKVSVGFSTSYVVK